MPRRAASGMKPAKDSGGQTLPTSHPTHIGQHPPHPLSMVHPHQEQLDRPTSTVSYQVPTMIDPYADWWAANGIQSSNALIGHHEFPSHLSNPGLVYGPSSMYGCLSSDNGPTVHPAHNSLITGPYYHFDTQSNSGLMQNLPQNPPHVPQASSTPNLIHPPRSSSMTHKDPPFGLDTQYSHAAMLDVMVDGVPAQSRPASAVADFSGEEFLNLPPTASTMNTMFVPLVETQTINGSTYDMDGLGQSGTGESLGEDLTEGDKVRKRQKRPGLKRDHKVVKQSSTVDDLSVDNIHSIDDFRKEILLCIKKFHDGMASVYKRTPGSIVQPCREDETIFPQQRINVLLRDVRSLSVTLSPPLPLLLDGESFLTPVEAPTAIETSQRTASEDNTSSSATTTFVLGTSPSHRRPPRPKLSLDPSSFNQNVDLSQPTPAELIVPHPEAKKNDALPSASLLPPAPSQIHGPWQDVELKRLHALILISASRDPLPPYMTGDNPEANGGVGVDLKNASVDWDWVANELGGARSRHQVLCQAVVMGWKDPSPRRRKRKSRSREISQEPDQELANQKEIAIEEVGRRYHDL